MDLEKIINYWQESAEENYQTAEYLYKGKRYADCLFFCHLMIKKALKALIVQKTKTHAPPIHDLTVLAKKSKTALPEKQIEEFKLTNLRIIQYDAVEVVNNMLPQEYLDGVHIFFPDTASIISNAE